MHRHDLLPRGDAQTGIEVGQRLVHQEDAGPPHHGAGQGHALPLPAGELPRLALQQRAQAERLRHRRHLGGDRGAAGTRSGPHGAEQRQALPQAEPPQRERHGDVLRHRQVRVKRVGLKDHRHVARRGVRPRHVPPVDHHAPGLDGLDAGDGAHQRRLAAARRAEERDELAARHVERDACQHPGHSEMHRHVADLQPGLPDRPGHAATPRGTRAIGRVSSSGKAGSSDHSAGLRPKCCRRMTDACHSGGVEASHAHDPQPVRRCLDLHGQAPGRVTVALHRHLRAFDPQPLRLAEADARQARQEAQRQRRPVAGRGPPMGGIEQHYLEARPADLRRRGEQVPAGVAGARC
jgi:hypothetical protein